MSDRKTDILQAARTMFNRSGWIHVGVREIARELDISPGNLSYHFPRKDDLLTVLLQDIVGEELQLMQGLAEKDSDMGTFLSGIHELLRRRLNDHGVLSALPWFEHRLYGPDKLRSVSEIRHALMRDMVRRLAESGQLKASGEDTAFLIESSLLFLRAWIIDQSIDSDRDIERRMYYLGQQFYYFATEAGMRSIGEFLDSM